MSQPRRGAAAGLGAAGGSSGPSLPSTTRGGRGRSSSRRVSGVMLAPAASTHSRTSRRRSVDPYPARGAGVAAAEAGGKQEEEEREEPVDSGSGEGGKGAGEAGEEVEERPPAASEGQDYELVILQQPEVGAETGLEKMTLGRLPIVPAPVVRLIVRNAFGEEVDIELPYLFCTCTLKEEDGVTPVEIRLTPAQRAANTDDTEALSALLGAFVRSSHRVTDLSGNTVSVFVFEDISVREKGRFRLEFRLGEAPKSPRLAAVLSDAFDVVPWEEYPGRPAEDILTPLSRHLMDQSVPMYVPPLVLPSRTGAAPLPPGQNPWVAHNPPTPPDPADT